MAYTHHTQNLWVGYMAITVIGLFYWLPQETLQFAGI